MEMRKTISVITALLIFSKKFIVGYVDFCDKNVIVDYWCLNKVRKLEGRDNQ